MTQAAPSSRYLVPQFTVTVSGEYETGRLATALAKVCVAGDLIRLVGELGAGKTTFSSHFLKALGHKGEVPSPTYTLMQVYEDTRFPVAHVDCYRMKDSSEMDDLGLEGYRKHGIILCEWPEKGGPLVDDIHRDFLDYHINSIENPGLLTLEIAQGEGQFGRVITLKGSPSWQHRFALLTKTELKLPDGLSRSVSDEGREAFLARAGVKNYEITGLGGDWSGRSYWRVKLADGTTRMLMDAPLPQEGVSAYVKVAAYYNSIGLHAAKTFAVDEDEGYLLSEDLGGTLLYDLVKDGADETDWYKAVADGLVKQCQSEVPAWGRRYSAKDWWVEAVRFTNWWLPYARGRATPVEDYEQWQALWAPLYERVMKMPLGFMMWDCQSPNLMILGNEPKLANLGWIDIQDARVAPVCQDLALLLRNIRTAQKDGREKEVLDYIAPKLGVDRQELLACMDICSLHHSCRIIGGLTRLHVRDGRSAPAKAYMHRVWEVARQSYDNPDLHEIVGCMKDWEAPGMARLWKETAGK